MAKKKQSWKYIYRVNGEIYAVYENGVMTYYKSEEEIEQAKKKMMENTGKRMSRYYEGHPEASIWNSKTLEG